MTLNYLQKVMTLTYYENWTTDGEEAQHKVVHARWTNLDDALADMQNYSNAWRKNGTGWIVQVTITVNAQNKVHIEQKKVYENS